MHKSIKMKKLLLAPFIFFLSCQQPQKVSEKEVMETFNEFFFLLDNDVEKIRNHLSADFMIFEGGIYGYWLYIRSF